MRNITRELRIRFPTNQAMMIPEMIDEYKVYDVSYVLNLLCLKWLVLNIYFLSCTLLIQMIMNLVFLSLFTMSLMC